MINTIEDTGGQKPDFQKYQAESWAQGADAALVRFFPKNNVAASHEDLVAFAELITRDVIGEEGYPFTKSYKEVAQQEASEISFICQMLYDNGEMDNLRKITRVVSYATMLKFLEDNKEEAIAIMAKIRAEKEAKK